MLRKINQYQWPIHPPHNNLDHVALVTVVQLARLVNQAVMEAMVVTANLVNLVNAVTLLLRINPSWTFSPNSARAKLHQAIKGHQAPKALMDQPAMQALLDLMEKRVIKDPEVHQVKMENLAAMDRKARMVTQENLLQNQAHLVQLVVRADRELLVLQVIKEVLEKMAIQVVQEVQVKRVPQVLLVNLARLVQMVMLANQVTLELALTVHQLVWLQDIKEAINIY